VLVFCHLHLTCRSQRSACVSVLPPSPYLP